MSSCVHLPLSPFFCLRLFFSFLLLISSFASGDFFFSFHYFVVYPSVCLFICLSCALVFTLDEPAWQSVFFYTLALQFFACLLFSLCSFVPTFTLIITVYKSVYPFLTFVLFFFRPVDPSVCFWASLLPLIGASNPASFVSSCLLRCFSFFLLVLQSLLICFFLVLLILLFLIPFVSSLLPFSLCSHTFFIRACLLFVSPSLALSFILFFILFVSLLYSFP